MSELETQTKRIEGDVDRLTTRFDRHLEIYANNGKELAALKSSVDSLSISITDNKLLHSKQERRISDLEVAVGKLAVKIGLYATVGSAIASSVAVFAIEKLLI